MAAKGRNLDDEHPLSYWLALARMGFENDVQRLREGKTADQVAAASGLSPGYCYNILGGNAPTPSLQTMVAVARALGGILEIRIVKEGGEVVRVVDFETAGALDDEAESLAGRASSARRSRT